MRTDMGVHLHVLFRDVLKREVTKENCAELCVMAANNALIFQYAAINPGVHHVRNDMTAMYCYTRGYSFWHPFYNAAFKTLNMYDWESLKKIDYVEAIFSTLDEVFAKIQATIKEAGMPPL